MVTRKGGDRMRACVMPFALYKERFEALGAKVAMELHFPIMDGPGYYDE